jgi:hypothetical protein
MHIMAHEDISSAYFINHYHQPVRLYVRPTTVAKQKLGENVTTPMNTHVTIEECLDE